MSSIVCFFYFLILGKKKLKLYRTPGGEVKGDGRCCYLKVYLFAYIN